MEDPITSPSEARDHSSSSLEATAFRRTLMLTGLRDWCMERLSWLSLVERMDCARALTAEYLELLETVDQSTTLWMVIEADD